MKQPNHANPEDINLNNAVPDMPESFRMRIRIACETLPEQERRLPVRGIALAAALCLVAVLAVFFSIGQLGGAPDMLTPLTNSASGGDTDLPGDGEEDLPGDSEEDLPGDSEEDLPGEDIPATAENGIDPVFVREGMTVERMKEAYGLAWPFESAVFDDHGQMFEGNVYLYEDTFDPYYHIDPETCGAGTKEDMIQTLRQTAYRRYDRELCPVCAPERDLELKVWLNEGSRFYHKEKECRGEVMQVQTTLQNAVEIYDVPELCRYCSELFTNPIDHLDEYIIEIDYTSYGLSLNKEWAERTVYLSPNGVYHYDPACTGETREGIRQQTAVQEHRAVPCRTCMGVYTGNLVVYTSEGEEQYHIRSVCGEKQLRKKLTQYDAMDSGLTICPECFKDY